MSKHRANAVVEAALSAANAAKKSQKFPAPGEVWWVDLNPVKGHEQGNYRPVVIVSVGDWNKETQRAIVVPVTRTTAPPDTLRHSMEVPLAGLPSACVALPDQVVTIDWVARNAEYKGHAVSPEELLEVRVRLAALMELQP